VKSTPKTDKTFDCVAFKREAQARIYEAIKDLSPREEIEFFRDAARTGPLGDWWQRISEERPQPNNADDIGTPS
jgi:hypothetical protein